MGSYSRTSHVTAARRHSTLTVDLGGHERRSFAGVGSLVVAALLACASCNQILGIGDVSLASSAPDAPACTPISCDSVGAECDPIDDGCNGSVQCGTCAAPDHCQDNKCVCAPATCMSLGADCGNPSDGCTMTLSCGACTLPRTCGGGGVDYVCGTPGMATVPAGPFLMGCSSLDSSCNDDEKPSHTVTLAGYEIDDTEVSESAYNACVQASACTVPSGFTPTTTPNAPVENVTYPQAVSYCTYAGKRLPTEAEWEKAARGTDGRVYPWGAAAPDCQHADFTSCGGAPVAVGSLPSGASPSGALEMSGNVSEWVADWYSPTYYSSSPPNDPPGPSTGSVRVIRGGSFFSAAAEIRTSSRESADPTVPSNRRGFRCARSL